MPVNGRWDLIRSLKVNGTGDTATKFLRRLHEKFWKYKVIPKSLRDFQPLRYSSRDGHAEGGMSTEGETLHVSVLPYRCSICPPLVTRKMSIL